MSDYFGAAFNRPMSRRTLIRSFAAAGVATWLAPGIAAGTSHPPRRSSRFADFQAIAPSGDDVFSVPPGYTHDVLLAWGDEFSPGLRFGYNCDYSAYFPIPGRRGEGVLAINHEYINAFFTSDWRSRFDPPPAPGTGTWDPRDLSRTHPLDASLTHRQVMLNEMADVGMSLVHVRRRGNGPWEVVYGSPYNKRIYGNGPLIPYDGPVAGSGLVPDEGSLGTLANCSGGTTPWGTVLSAEENYQSYGLRRRQPFALGWIRDPGGPDEDLNYYIGEAGVNIDGESIVGPSLTVDPRPLNRERPYYGYIVEVDPLTGTAVKHTAMGRIHHENVAMRIASDGRVVAYTGDDAPARDGMFFKFVSAGTYSPSMTREEAMSLLSEGQLYVSRWLPNANPGGPSGVSEGTGTWHAIDMEDPEALAFTTAWIELNIIAANGYALNEFRVPRAEDCEVVPGRPTDVVVALTSATSRHPGPTDQGVVRLLREASEDPDSTLFQWVDLLHGGQPGNLANPDNIGFSAQDEMWVVTDISTNTLGAGGYAWHLNNALYYVPLRGPNANVAFRFANAPVGAELTGPTFVDDPQALFINVQHPGEPKTANLDRDPTDPLNYDSWWPGGNRVAQTGSPGKPKPSLVAVRKL